MGGEVIKDAKLPRKMVWVEQRERDRSEVSTSVTEEDLGDDRGTQTAEWPMTQGSYTIEG